MPNRLHRSVITFASGVSILLGMGVMLAWHAHFTPIIQVLPGFPPIRYNTALAFLLSGLALLMVRFRQPQILAAGLSTLVFLIGSLTLAEYTFDIDLGIDQLFMRDYLTNQLYAPGQSPLPIREPIHQFFITVARPLPGRPSPNAATALTCVGIALLGLSCLPQNSTARLSCRQTKVTACTGILATGVIGIGTVALLGYLTEVGTAHTWRFLTGISIPTALGLIVLGMGLLSAALSHDSTHRLPAWFPLSMGSGVLTASLLLWQALISWSNNIISQLPSFGTQVQLLLRPVANLVLLGGLLLALLLTSVLYFAQRVKAQADILSRLNQELAQSQALIEATLEATADGIVALDVEKQVIHANRRFIQMWRIPRDVVNAVRAGNGEAGFRFVVSQLKSPNAFVELSQHMMDQLEQTTFDVLELQDGRTFERYSRPQWLGDRVVGKVLSFRDITRRKQMEDALFYEKELAQVTLHSIGDAVITTDTEGTIEYINPVAETLTGWRQQEAQGLPLSTVFQIFHEDTRQAVDNPVDLALRENQIVELAKDTVLIARDGREIGIDDSAAPIHNRNGQTVGAVMVFHDVTQNRQLSRQVSWQAIHDPLTGLVNRRAFEQQLEQAICSAAQYSQTHALCYLDLDQFKIVNDTCGHVAGDELLRQVTNLFQAQVRKTDVLARLGGDEFGILLHQCPLNQAEHIANLLREKVQAFRFLWEDKSFSIGVSIGLVAITAESESLANLLIAADAACYAAKNSGRNRIQVFRPDDHALVQQQSEIQWVVRLNHALEENRFCLYAQRVAALSSTANNEDHYEVLLRLHDETGALVLPMAFIPAAERYNLMHTIDRWVINTLFQNWSLIQASPQLTAPPCPSSKPHVFAINLSGASLNDDQFIDFLADQFDRYPVSPHLICFEITETVAITNLSKASQFMHALQQLGCRFSLDDFGSGMSSFAYLKNLPVNYLKIDGSFIKNIINDPVDDAIVAAMTDIGHVMGLKTIAECVENDVTLQHLKAHGVDYAQGYGLSRPQPLVLNEPRPSASVH